MLAPHDLPPAYVQWNAAHRAPFGRSVGGIAARLRLGGMSAAAIRFRGPFAWQGNNTTREFEYPWAQEQIAAHGSQLDVVDVGGGLSGLQWVLAREGHRVVNVDPGFAAGAAAFEVDSATHARLSRIYRAPVRLEPSAIQDAGLKDRSVDVVLSISAVEHFASEDVVAFVDTIRRIVRPGGILVLTVDLFLNLRPFTRREENRFGTNVDVAQLVAATGMECLVGDPSELYGYAEFDAEQVLTRIERYAIGRHYPSLTQLVVAQQPHEYWR